MCITGKDLLESNNKILIIKYNSSKMHFEYKIKI